MLSEEKVVALVQRVKAGDAEAGEALVRGYLRAAYAVALALLGRPSDAEDTAQDAFLSAFEHIGTCREEAKFGGWLLQIVRNQAKNRLTRRKFRDVLKEESANETVFSGASPETAGIRRDLLRALSLLTPMQREVVLLHDLEGWTHPEIGAALGISAVMSRQHLYFARRGVRAELEREEEKKEVFHG